MSENLSEPVLQRLCLQTWGNSLEPFTGGKATDEAVRTLFSATEAFEKQEDSDDYRRLWLKVRRGSIEDWLTYEQYEDDWFEPNGTTDAPSKETWFREWEYEFPEPIYWHLLEVNRFEDGVLVALDKKACIGTGTTLRHGWDDPSVIDALVLITKTVEGIALLARRGQYPRLLESELPACKRRGIVLRSDLWDVDPSLYSLAPNVNHQELARITDVLRHQTSREGLPPIEGLTTGRYFSVLMDSFKAAGYKLEESDCVWGFPASDGRAWYCRFGDARDRSILEVDPDSPSAFAEWDRDPTVFRNHTFEIIAGHGFSRCHLYPKLENDGWHLDLYGSIPYHGFDLYTIWRTFNDAGLPTYLHDAEELAAALLGEDYLLVVPDHELPFYKNGNYDGHRVVEAIHLPENHELEVASKVAWFPIEVTAKVARRETPGRL